MASAIQNRTATELAEAFVQSHRSVISTAEGIRRIRYVLPTCAESEKELTDLIAASAVRAGKIVAFDTAR